MLFLVKIKIWSPIPKSKALLTAILLETFWSTLYPLKVFLKSLLVIPWVSILKKRKDWEGKVNDLYVSDVTLNLSSKVPVIGTQKDAVGDNKLPVIPLLPENEIPPFTDEVKFCKLVA